MNRSDLRGWLMDTKVSGPARCVFLVLLAHANDKTGVAWTSIATLAGESGFGRTTVKTALRELRGSGDVTIQHRSGTSSRIQTRSPGDRVMVGMRPGDGRNSHKTGSPGDHKGFEGSIEGAHAAGGARGPVITDNRGTFMQGTGWIQ